jgi:hypothetical protein
MAPCITVEAHHPHLLLPHSKLSSSASPLLSELLTPERRDSGTIHEPFMNQLHSSRLSSNAGRIHQPVHPHAPLRCSFISRRRLTYLASTTLGCVLKRLNSNSAPQGALLLRAACQGKVPHTRKKPTDLGLECSIAY